MPRYLLRSVATGHVVASFVAPTPAHLFWRVDEKSDATQFEYAQWQGSWFDDQTGWEPLTVSVGMGDPPPKS